jgi:hypothetical protein
MDSPQDDKDPAHEGPGGVRQPPYTGLDGLYAAYRDQFGPQVEHLVRDWIEPQRR